MPATTKHARRLTPAGYAFANTLARRLRGLTKLSEVRAPSPWSGIVTVLQTAPVYCVEYRTDAHDRAGEVWRGRGDTLAGACTALVKVVDHD